VKDSVWDFDDGTNVLARDIQGSKSRIDFGGYDSLNTTILFEIKWRCCALEIPGPYESATRPRFTSRTPSLIFLSQLSPFFDQMSERKRLEQGEDF
jgi:hypothetical protein